MPAFDHVPSMRACLGGEQQSVLAHATQKSAGFQPHRLDSGALFFDAHFELNDLSKKFYEAEIESIGFLYF
jgi:hypothetical protein